MRYMTAGESHGPEEVAIIEGIPAGLTLTQADIDEQLARRLVKKITIFKRYMEFKFKDGEVIRINK